MCEHILLGSHEPSYSNIRNWHTLTNVFHQGRHISRTERCGLSVAYALTGEEHWLWADMTGERGQVPGLSISSAWRPTLSLVRQFLGCSGRSPGDLGRDLSKWLSKRDPRVLSIQSQESRRLWTSCTHWMYPVLYLCWASSSRMGSAWWLDQEKKTM